MDRGPDRVGALAGKFRHHVARVVDSVSVVARSAPHGVGLVAAVEDVGATEALEHVGAFPAVQQVVILAAPQGVVAAIAVELVVAGEAAECVVAIVARQGIRVGGADEILDVVELVAGGVAVESVIVHQRDINPAVDPS